MISPVSFSSTTPVSASSFQDKIKQPQTYLKQDVAAASNLNGKEKKEKTGKHTFAKILIGAAAIAAALAAGSKFGIFAQKEAGNALVNKGKGYLDVAGKAILEQAGKLKGLISKKTK